MPNPTPQILVWARETAGLSVEDAATKLQIGSARGRTGAERIAAIEAGEAAVSRSLLLRMAKTYRRPLLTFYLQQPPERGDLGEDFRAPANRRPDVEPLVDALVRDIMTRQSMVRALLEEDEETERLAFVGSADMTDGVGHLVASIARALGIDRNVLRRQPSPDVAFSVLRAAVEATGVFVILVGNLGSHHTNIDALVFRGFALADPIAPFIAVNDLDAKAAWSFTLLHELAHLWLGRSGVSGAYSQGRLEQFCNDVASQFLLADNELANVGVGVRTPIDEAAQLINEFARPRNLSRALVAYRLYRAGSLTENMSQALTLRFLSEWRRFRAERRERDDGEGGPSYYTVRRHRLGRALVNLVARTVDEGLLTPTKAGRVLGVKPRSVLPLLSSGGPG
jgi:Zn-dependent peptidase ImmA (M78 family)